MKPQLRPLLARVVFWGTPVAGLLLLSRYFTAEQTSNLRLVAQIAGLVLLGLWLLFLLGVWLTRRLEARQNRRKSERMSAALRERMAADSSAGPELDHGERMRRRWKEDVHERLRQKGYDYYSMPFYLLIGASQSGKTTAIGESGLEFPIGPKPVEDYGGTKDCKWFFTNDAVIIDTAGRYVESLGTRQGQEGWNPTHPESQKEWDAFLRMLAKERKRAPINGVLLAIRVPDLQDPNPRNRERLVTALRSALLDIEEKLGLRAPVYLVVTMCDLIPGFLEYCHHLPGLSDRTLFGWSSTADEKAGYSKELLNRGLEELNSRLDGLLLGFYESELSRGPVAREDQERIDRTTLFPDEFRALREPLAEIVDRLFAPSAYHDLHLLRGVFFTSGTQWKGKPIARAAMGLLGERASGLIEMGSEGRETKSYFIADLFRDLIFKESGLVKPSSRAQKETRRRQRLSWGIVCSVGVVFLALTLWRSYRAIEDASSLVSSDCWESQPESVERIHEHLSWFDLFDREAGTIEDAYFKCVASELTQRRQKWIDAIRAGEANPVPPGLGFLARWVATDMRAPNASKEVRAEVAAELKGAAALEWTHLGLLLADQWWPEGNTVEQVETSALIHACGPCDETKMQAPNDNCWGLIKKETLPKVVEATSEWSGTIRLAAYLANMWHKAGCPLDCLSTQKTWLDNAAQLVNFQKSTVQATVTPDPRIAALKIPGFAGVLNATAKLPLTFQIGDQNDHVNPAWSEIVAYDHDQDGSLVGAFSRADFLLGLYKGDNLQSQADGGLLKTVKLPSGDAVKFQFDLDLPLDISKWVKDP